MYFIARDVEPTTKLNCKCISYWTTNNKILVNAHKTWGNSIFKADSFYIINLGKTLVEDLI
jgi:hypothetical protein